MIAEAGRGAADHAPGVDALLQAGPGAEQACRLGIAVQNADAQRLGAVLAGQVLEKWGGFFGCQGRPWSDSQQSVSRASISAETKIEKEEKKGEKVLRSERYVGKVARSFTLAHDIDEAKAKASTPTACWN